MKRVPAIGNGELTFVHLFEKIHPANRDPRARRVRCDQSALRPLQNRFSDINGGIQRSLGLGAR